MDEDRQRKRFQTTMQPAVKDELDAYAEEQQKDRSTVIEEEIIELLVWEGRLKVGQYTAGQKAKWGEVNGKSKGA